MAEHTIKVSIITVSYNAVKTIEQTIQSVLKQSYRNIEYLVIDGGSTDKTQEIIEKYKNAITYYVSEPDEGIYDAMNKGIAHATGDVIGIVNSDDWYEPDAVEKVAECFEKSDAGVVFGEIWLVGQGGERIRCTSRSCLPPHPAMFVRRDIYQTYGVFDTDYKIAADYELTRRLQAAGVRFARIDGILSNFRMSGISHFKNKECIEETYQINLMYAGRCPGESLTKEIAEELYDRSRLLYISQHSPEKILTALRQKFPELEQGIIIFGTGSWGQELHTVLKNCHVNISFFVDNDDKKWNFEFGGSRIYSPEILRDCHGYIFIAMKKFQKEIRDQIFTYAKGNLVVDTYDRLWKGAYTNDEW